jgi:hypothetical protein
MFKFRKTTSDGDIRFCERCGLVCDAGCFAEESRQRVFDQLVRSGWRLA